MLKFSVQFLGYCLLKIKKERVVVGGKGFGRKEDENFVSLNLSKLKIIKEE